MEAAEAGGRYLAPILILPGMFQSYACWRGMTSMLAHRGWNVYVLARSEIDDRGAVRTENFGWIKAVERAAEVASKLDERVIVFGADLGAALAVAMLGELRPLALGLFAPATPAALGRSDSSNAGARREPGSPSSRRKRSPSASTGRPTRSRSRPHSSRT